MAERPIFIVEAHGSALVTQRVVDFTWHAGMAKSRRQMSMRSLHKAAATLYPEARILEVSRMSDDPLGERLSAFNLPTNQREGGRETVVECAFQASKVFERGGPFLDLLEASPADAKRDPRLQKMGQLTGFRYCEERWPNKPPTAFYDWLYVSALHHQPKLAEKVANFDIFTDIAFNPKKSINCQAGAAALYVALRRRSKLEEALSSREAFLRFEADPGIADAEKGIQGKLL